MNNAYKARNLRIKEKKEKLNAKMTKARKARRPCKEIQIFTGPSPSRPLSLMQTQGILVNKKINKNASTDVVDLKCKIVLLEETIKNFSNNNKILSQKLKQINAEKFNLEKKNLKLEKTIKDLKSG